MSDGGQRCFFMSLLAFLSFCSGGCLRKVVPEERCAKDSSLFGGIRRLRKLVPEKRCAKDSSLFGGIRRCVRKRVERFKNRNKVAHGQENLKEKPEEIEPEEIDPVEKYKFIRLIGQGCVGSVYVAEDPEYRRLVAIKAQSNRPSGKISNEVMGMKKSKHPNVVNFIGSHIVGDKFWIVMEYVSGVCLGDIIYECHMTEGNIAAVTRECLQAMEFMHKQNVAHGDIHSQNVLIGHDGSVKIADFGLCTIFEDGRSCPKEEEVETVPFAVPEVPMSKERATKLDILRLGMTVIEMFDTDLPFYDLLGLWLNEPGSPKITCSLQFLDFADRCYENDIASRASASELLRHPFLALATPLEDLKPLVLAAKME